VTSVALVGRIDTPGGELILTGCVELDESELVAMGLSSSGSEHIICKLKEFAHLQHVLQDGWALFAMKAISRMSK